MSGLPAGTVTMVFSDIEGSTALLSRLGEAYAVALVDQRDILRAAWSRWNGVEMGTEGDSFFVVFPVARDAVSATVQAQRAMAAHRWPARERVAARMGVHTGEPTVHDGGYVGIDVHRAARIAATAHGGQVVISDATRALVAGGLPDDVSFEDLGWHRLKDIGEPERLFQLSGGGLRSDFPPLRSLGTTSSLPTPPTSLIGREGELRELGALLSLPQTRLVTLTGAGGSGKTRLATALAAGELHGFRDGVFFVPLAAATSAQAAWSTIAEVVSVGTEARERSRFLDFLHRRRMLLVLDNLEQLPAASTIVAALLAAAPEVVVIATSRRPLHLQGEHEHPVPPLELPDSVDVSEAERSGAVRLFVERAAMVRPSFALTPDNSAVVAAICRRLDGLPLAIELAAARSKLLSPAALLARLDTTTGLRAADVDRPGRQRTLQAAIAWSYDLLTPELQAVFRRLGVFAGGADLEAVTAVTEDLGLAADSLDCVAELVDVSLATVHEGPDGEPRVQLLQTVTDYARQLLSDSGEMADAQRRHAEHYLQRAKGLVPGLYTQEQLAVQDRVEMEHDNLREALGWALPGEAGPASTSDRVRLGMRLAATVWWFWDRSGSTTEALMWLRRALDAADKEEEAELAGVLQGMGHLLSTGSAADREEADRLLVRALAIFRRLGDTRSVADVLIASSWAHGRAVQLDTLRARLEEAIALLPATGGEALRSRALYRLGEVAHASGDHESAMALVVRARDIRARLGDDIFVAQMQDVLAYLMLETGRVEEARNALDALVPTLFRLKQPTVKLQVLESYVLLLSRLGALQEATTARGAVEALREQLGLAVDAPEDQLLEAEVAGFRSQLGPDAWETAIEAGRRLSSDEALMSAHKAAAACRG